MILFASLRHTAAPNVRMFNPEWDQHSGDLSCKPLPGNSSQPGNHEAKYMSTSPRISGTWVFLGNCQSALNSQPRSAKSPTPQNPGKGGKRQRTSSAAHLVASTHLQMSFKDLLGFRVVKNYPLELRTKWKSWKNKYKSGCMGRVYTALRVQRFGVGLGA